MGAKKNGEIADTKDSADKSPPLALVTSGTVSDQTHNTTPGNSTPDSQYEKLTDNWKSNTASPTKYTVGTKGNISKKNISGKEIRTENISPTVKDKQNQPKKERIISATAL